MALLLLPLLMAAQGCTQNPLENPPAERPRLIVDGHIALAALIALGDGHIRQMASGLHLLANTDAAHKANWSRLEGQLTNLGKVTVPATFWVALPDGTYRTAVTGQTEANLPPRGSYAAAIAGESIIGKLAISPSTGEPIAVVAVPMVAPNGQVSGILGASILLRQFSRVLRAELDLDEHMTFYAFDGDGVIAVRSESTKRPPVLDAHEEIARIHAEATPGHEGILRYTLRQRTRTFLYRQSTYNDWWYTLGVVHID